MFFARCIVAVLLGSLHDQCNSVHLAQSKYQSNNYCEIHRGYSHEVKDNSIANNT